MARVAHGRTELQGVVAARLLYVRLSCPALQRGPRWCSAPRCRRLFQQRLMEAYVVSTRVRPKPNRAANPRGARPWRRGAAVACRPNVPARAAR